MLTGASIREATIADADELGRISGRAWEALYLDPDVIGSGVGLPLFERAAGDLRDRGFNPLVVWAFRDNHRARGFYEHMGLTIDVADQPWLLGGMACPIVRFRVDWPSAG